MDTVKCVTNLLSKYTDTRALVLNKLSSLWYSLLNLHIDFLREKEVSVSSPTWRCVALILSSVSSYFSPVPHEHVHYEG